VNKHTTSKRILMVNGIAIIVLALGLGIWLSVKTHRPNQPLALQGGTILKEPVSLKEFNLTDFNGKPFTNESLKGHWTLIFFGFINCPMICPTTLAQLNNAYKEWQQSDTGVLPKMVFISIDPDRDTPKELKAYLAKFNPAFIGVTGNKAALSHLTKNLGIMYAKIKKPNTKNYDITHSTRILVINPDGEWAAILSAPRNGNILASNMLRIQRENQ